MSQDELFLITSILSGNQASEKMLYQRYERTWFRLCLRYARNRSEAQDMLQEALILIFRDLKQFDAARGSFQNWSNRVLINAALRYLKKYHWQQSFSDLTAIQEETDQSINIIGEITAKELTLLIQQLPIGYRLVFNLFVIEGYAHKEIAALLNISVSTSKTQLFKAKKALRQKIEILF